MDTTVTRSCPGVFVRFRAPLQECSIKNLKVQYRAYQKSHYFEIAKFYGLFRFYAVHLGNIPFTFACIVPIDANVLIPKFETS
jgi:hypothetical protein